MVAVGAAGLRMPAQDAQDATPPAVQALQQQRTSSQGQTARAEGVVTGTVMCTDTQAAARFAMVTLIPVKQDDDGGRGGPGRFMGGGGSGRTDLQGNFTVSNVAAGDYYVAASATGYVSAVDMLRMVGQEGGDTGSVLASLPQVHVMAGSSSNVSLSLTRGGVLSGKLVWDDGSPAAGVGVTAMLQTEGTAPAQGNRADLMFGFGSGGGLGPTDDRGQFRLTGLMPGTYLLRATVETPASGASRGFTRGFVLAMYAPGKIRKTEAKAITLGPAEERDDVGFTLSLAALHTVSGHVAAVSGPAVMSGAVRLVDTTDSSLSRTASVGEDGSFVLTYVPSGSYTLTATGSTSAASAGGYGRGGRGGSSQGSSFQAFTESLSVTDGDVTNLEIELTPGNGSR